MTIFSKNLKRFRLSKSMTQEQAAQALGVSAQTVSRWECNTTLPDVTMLPQIARLYCVTIDDLYQESSLAYDNYAQRLGSVFEATRQPEDYFRAELEYRKLLKSGEYTNEDLRLYAILQQYMMQVCMEKAEELFDRVLKQGPDADPEIYWRVRRQKGYFLSQIGRVQEEIDALLPIVQAGSLEVNEWICLIQALQFAEKTEDALEWGRQAEQRFPENYLLHINMGDLCKAMGRYEEAFRHWHRALELEPEWMDGAYAMGFCYEELEEYEKAMEIWTGIADDLAGRGYEAEVNWPRDRARKCREKLKKPDVKGF